MFGPQLLYESTIVPKESSERGPASGGSFYLIVGRAPAALNTDMLAAPSIAQ